MIATSKIDDGERPPDHILEWCRNVVRIIADGGVWGIPRSGTTFRLDHKNKRLVLTIAGNDDDADFEATKHVFSYIGWDVIKEDKNEHT
jgi:hypothetical protein